MRNRISPPARLVSALATLAAAALLAPMAQAQFFQHKKNDCGSAPCYSAPSTVTPEPGKAPDMTQPPAIEPTFSAEQATAGSFEGFAADSGVGYIDPAPIRSMFRLRYDSAYDANRPDRAEFIYPKCGCFRLAGLDPNAKGPPPGGFGTNPSVPSDTNVDYMEYSAYLELAMTRNFSAFVEVPLRSVNFSQFSQENGLGDVNFGVKAALINTADRVFTFQFRTYTPTGDGAQGLGTEHFSLEPALLLYNRLSDRWIVESELRYWISVGGSDYAGDVIRYGIGLTYVLADTGKFRILPVVEVVGWSVLSGKETNPDLATPTAGGGGLGGGGGGNPFAVVQSASGDTIVNAKFGVRFGFGRARDPGLFSGSDLYIGYGRALTGDVWYKDIVRIEYRMPF